MLKKHSLWHSSTSQAQALFLKLLALPFIPIPASNAQGGPLLELQPGGNKESQHLRL